MPANAVCGCYPTVVQSGGSHRLDEGLIFGLKMFLIARRLGLQCLEKCICCMSLLFYCIVVSLHAEDARQLSPPRSPS